MSFRGKKRKIDDSGYNRNKSWSSLSRVVCVLQEVLTKLLTRDRLERSRSADLWFQRWILTHQNFPQASTQTCTMSLMKLSPMLETVLAVPKRQKSWNLSARTLPALSVPAHLDVKEMLKNVKTRLLLLKTVSFDLVAINSVILLDITKSNYCLFNRWLSQ